MAKGKKSFIIYTDSRCIVNKLSNERAGILFKTLFSYCDDENPVCDDEVVDIVFEHFKNILKRDLKKYEKIVERNRENGKNGGRPKNPVGSKKTQKKQNKPKKADSDNVNVTVNDNVNVILSKWVDYRKEIKKPISDASIKKVIETFNNTPLKKLEYVVNLSIMNGWQGLFFDKYKEDNKQEPGKIKLDTSKLNLG